MNVRQRPSVPSGAYAFLLPSLARHSGSERGAQAHGLPHIHAEELRSEGVDIGVINKQFEHRSLFATIRYLDHISSAAVITGMGKSVWGGA